MVLGDLSLVLAYVQHMRPGTYFPESQKIIVNLLLMIIFSLSLVSKLKASSSTTLNIS